METADFGVRMRDEITPGANSARGSVRALNREMQAVRGPRLGDMRRRFAGFRRDIAARGGLFGLLATSSMRSLRTLRENVGVAVAQVRARLTTGVGAATRFAAMRFGRLGDSLERFSQSARLSLSRSGLAVFARDLSSKVAVGARGASAAVLRLGRDVRGAGAAAGNDAMSFLFGNAWRQNLERGFRSMSNRARMAAAAGGFNIRQPGLPGGGMVAMTPGVVRMGRALEAVRMMPSRIATGIRSMGSRAGAVFSSMGGGIRRNLTGAFDAFAKRFDRFDWQGVARRARSALGIIGIGIAALGAGITALTVGMVDYAQTSRVMFERVKGPGETAAQLIERSRQLAVGLGLDVKDTGRQMAQFKSFGFDTKMSEDLLKAGADLSAFKGDAEAANRIFLQIGKIQSQTKLQGDELMILAENGLQVGKVYDVLQERLGKTREEIAKMQQTGKLTSDIAIPAIIEGIRRQLGGGELGSFSQEIMENTLGGMAKGLKSRIQSLFLDVAAQSEGPIVDAARELFGVFNAGLEGPGRERMIERIAAGVSMLGKVIKVAIPATKEFFSAFSTELDLPKFGEMFEGDGRKAIQVAGEMGERFGILANRIGSITDALMRLLGPLETVAGWFDRLDKYNDMLGVANPLNLSKQADAAIGVSRATFGNDLKDRVGGVRQAASALPFASEETAEQAAGAFQRFVTNTQLVQAQDLMRERGIEVGTAAMDGIVQGIVNNTEAEATMWQKMQGLWLTAKAALGIASPSKPFMEIGVNLDRSAAMGLGRHGFAQQAAGDMAGGILGAMQFGSEADTPTFSSGAAALPTFTSGAAQAVAGAATGGGTFNFYGGIHVTIDGAGNSDEENGRQSARAVQRQIKTMFENRGLEGG